jgi:tetratricopeptide (TPR) repeat protein
MNAPLQLAASTESPFPGLRPFAYADHEHFFGREGQTYALYRLIDRSRFVAVVGSSGSGKSSLVRAGLLPLLDDESRESGGRSWLWRDMRPGDEPLQRLTILLAGLSVDDDPIAASSRRERIAAQLRRSSFGISEALAETAAVTGKSLVLLIDQFEELFRYAAAASDKTDQTANDIRARDEATQFVQLLLEASRTPLNRIHVILTMRSDFIGDCARFHGLPEAVSAAQFLVPSLTRDQLDEVIRKPVEQAEATIDPRLVERLLNDCGSEMDQLPVLQHCLSRLWDEAGKNPDMAATPDASPGELASISGQSTPRHLSLNHYRNVGEFADALSRHADEILQDLSEPTLQLAVEQTFRALSELDKEGRAIRRALKFSQLVAETGVDEAAVRQVLERFRADDCSFLTPSPFEVKEIGGTTRIDVGHEALLRRWEKVSGRRAELGWLRAEQRAGERYRALLAMAEGDKAALPAHLVEQRWSWWSARPRTPAWAERYGGNIDRVQRLLEVSQWRQSVKRQGIAAAFIALVGIAGLMAWLYWSATTARLEADKNLRAAVQAQATANARRKEALQSTKTSIGRLKGFLDDGTLRAAGAQQFLEDAKATLEQISKAGDHSPEIAEIEVSLLLAVSDVKEGLGDYKAASEFATEAETLAEDLVGKHPAETKFKHLLYASKFRIGDQLAKTRAGARQAEEKYLAAVNLAEQMIRDDPGNMERHQHGLTVVINKVGDMHKSRQDWQGALDRYRAGLRIAQAIADKYPADIATQKNRIAQVFSERGQAGDFDAAQREYREAIDIQTELLKKAPGNAGLISNIAATRRRIGGLLKGNPAKAQKEYEEAVALRKQILEGDPGNMAWRTGITTDYTLLGDTLMEKEDWREASRTYNDAIRIATGTALRNPDDVGPQRTLSGLRVKRADALMHRGALALNRQELEEFSRRIKDALELYRAAEQKYESLVESGNPLYRDLFNVRIKIGNAEVRDNKHSGALTSYQAASATAERAAATQRTGDWQFTLAATIEETGDSLAKRPEDRAAGITLAAEKPPNSLNFYEKAVEVIDTGLIREPDHQGLQSKKEAINAKIESRRPPVQ